MKEIKKKAEISDIDPVPLYRSYGVKKEEGFFARFNVLLARIIATTLFVLLAVAFCIALYSLLYMLRALGVAIAAIGVFCFVYFKLLRTARKRAKFMRKLKKACRKNGFTMTVERGFFKGLKKNTTGYDLTVKTNSGIWCVRFFASRTRNTHLIFEDEKTLTVRTNIIKNRIKMAYGLTDERNVRMEYLFNDPLPPSVLPVERALILNPVPNMIFKKDSDGVICAAGSGEKMPDYTIYTGSGFIETVLRASQA